MEIIFLANGAITLLLLVVHLADYFLYWPPQPFAVAKAYPTVGGPGGVAHRPLPEAYSYDNAA